jgi:hypothetical protein
MREAKGEKGGKDEEEEKKKRREKRTTGERKAVLFHGFLRSTVGKKVNEKCIRKE